jgi:hypothetical protein
MKNNNKIVIVDAKSSITPFMNQLRQAGFELIEILSSNADKDLFFNSFTPDSVKFALSGTDVGMDMALQINMRCGLAQKQNPDIFYNKISQARFLQSIAPQWALTGTQIFACKNELKDYLKNQDNICIRPEISYVNGSAILYQGPNPDFEKEIDHLFKTTSRVITHPWVDGDSYFINGVVIQGELYLTDQWRCFNLLENNRYILTSVVSLNHDDFIQAIKPDLQLLCEQFGLEFSPIHFEIIKTQNTFKIVKLVPRLATEPLPTLCRLIDKSNQMDVFFQSLTTSSLKIEETAHSFSADYSFVVKHDGHLIASQHHLLQALPSYHNFYYLPAIGSYLSRTICGASYGMTVLLKNNTQQQILDDIAYCQQLNSTGEFLSIRQTQ